MIPAGEPLICCPVRRQVLFGGTLLLILLCLVTPLVAQDDSSLMIDRAPFDRVILNAENDNAVIDVVLLELPDHRLPDPLPQNGTLQLRRLSHPTLLYNLEWKSIAQIKLYEQLVLEEALSLSNAGKSLEAFQTLQFLHKNYPSLPGLAEASEQYVKREALDAFAAKRYDESLMILQTLYDLNSQHQGLAEAVRAVSDRVINAQLTAGEFAAARSVLDQLKAGFPDLNLPNIATWEDKFQQGAARQLQIAQDAMEQGQYDEARVAIRRAEDILPKAAGALELKQTIDRLSPQIIVGVCQLAVGDNNPDDLRWAPARARRLTDPPLIEMVGFGGEGGEYRSRWASMSSDDSGRNLELTLAAPALGLGLSPERIALSLLSLADPAQQRYQEDFAAVFANVTIQKGQQVSVHWQHPHVRPEALLRIPLVSLYGGDDVFDPPGVYRAIVETTEPPEVTYRLSDQAGDSLGPPTIVERAFAEEEQAIAALRRGAVSVLDQVAPWHVELLQSSPRVSLASYRLPTVHVLQLNYAKPLLASREFRRAICYGIDRQRIVQDILLAGKQRAGYRVLSGPLPAGISVSDPVGYGYDQQLPPRPYEPRLASVLATVARNSLGKQKPSENEEDPVQTPPLLLAHPPNSIARTCCQSIQVQLTAVGIPVKLKELPVDSSALPDDYDLLYAQLAVREPLVDVRRLLGPRGSAGTCSSSMTLALEQLDQARNWNEARDRLRAVHQTAYHDLPVIPLWQTVDSFAYRKALRGVGRRPVMLYQNVAEWLISYDDEGR